MMKHLWSCLSGLSSQFSPTRRGYEWLICMGTGAFTSILIETAVACRCVAWFSCTRREELWRIGREDKSVTRMYLSGGLWNGILSCIIQTFKIIASFLSILSLFFFLPLTRAQTLTAPLKERFSNYYMQFYLHWQVLNKRAANFGGEIYLHFLIDDIYRCRQSDSGK